MSSQGLIKVLYRLSFAKCLRLRKFISYSNANSKLYDKIPLPSLQGISYFLQESSSLKFLHGSKKNGLVDYSRLFSTNGESRDSNHEKDQDNEKSNKPPPLMKTDGLQTWPSLFYTVRNWFISKVIIQSYFDPDFNLTDFLQGAKQALVYVSSQLASGSFNTLEGVITSEALSEIKSNYNKFTLAQRQQLEVKKQDIYFSFPYQIGIILDDDSTKRYAEILVVFHCIYGLGNLTNVESIHSKEYGDRVTICNYRFRREFTKGIDGGWVINQLNHFKAVDLKE